MNSSCTRLEATQEQIPTRIGFARLVKLSFDGGDFTPLWNDLLQSVARDRLNAAATMDMSVIAQLLGDQSSGLALQAAALNIQRLYRSPCSTTSPRLRVLALAAATDIGGNTPLEFLLQNTEIELYTLYIVPGTPLPEQLPPHDVAVVVASDSDSVSATLCEIERLVRNWPMPVVNLPKNIRQLDRDKLHILIGSIPGIYIPATARLSRKRLFDITRDNDSLRNCIGGGLPLIVRPIDCHAGRGLAKLDLASDIDAYLIQRPESEFFISPYVDYMGTDNLFRKYRIIFVDGRPFACHMAISDQWKVWYYNANMAQRPDHRSEEARFMATFDSEFAKRHEVALAEIARRIDLDYFGIDCAETKSGELLIFEADNVMIVHNMDSADIFPYKITPMQALFDSFAALLYRRAQEARAHAA